MNGMLMSHRQPPASARRRSPLLMALLWLAPPSLACSDDDALLASAAQAGTPPGWQPPTLRGEVRLADDALARAALAVLGSAAVGAEGSCNGCHSLGRPTLTRWSALTRAFDAACLTDPVLPDAGAVDAMLECFREHGERSGASRSGSFAAADFGIYAAAAHLPWFRFVFEHGSQSPDERSAQRDAFIASVGMPRAGTPLTQEQFDVVAEWFARGLPELYQLVPEDNGEDCTPGLDPRLGVHLDQMELSGWRARNEQTPLLMFGCGEGEAGAACLGDFETARDAGFDWDAPGPGTIRVLHDTSDRRTRFWSRTSPDGRYIASGLLERSGSDFTGQFLDLQQGRAIDADFSYDPTFFPDNSGFLVQRDGGFSSAAPGGGPTSGSADRGDVAVICDQSVLADDPDAITGEEAQCITLDSEIGLYQQLAKSLDGEDYWVVYGAYDSDNGGLGPVLENPSAAFGSDSVTTLVPMINQGARFEPGTATRVPMPLQGDPMLSPSGRLMVTRVKGREYMRELSGEAFVSAEQSGYALHLVSLTKSGDTWSAELTDMGRICTQGGKAVLSYDERWMIFHRYVTAADAEALGFESADADGFDRYLELGASNLYLVDLRDGSARPITAMAPGQYALFPHFRSDGWIYFVVRTLDGEEYFAASDAALLLESSTGG